MIWPLLTFGLFFIASGIHLFFCYKENEKYRRITKLFLMPLLMLFVFTLQTGRWQILLIALLFGFIGDIFIIYKRNKWMFLVGELSFFLGHLVYIYLFFLEVEFINSLLAIMLTLVGAIILQFPLYYKFKPYYKALTIPNNIYSTSLIVLVTFAIFVVIYQGIYPAILLPIGSVSFMVSDSLIAYNLFYKKQKRHDFYIMIFYLLAQILLSLGLLL